MIVPVHCEHCGHNFEAEASGKTAPCPGCGKEIRYDLGAVAPMPTDKNGVSDGILFCGYMGAVFMPPVGFFVGLYLLAIQKAGHGAAIMAFSVIFFLIWLVIFFR